MLRGLDRPARGAHRASAASVPSCVSSTTRVGASPSELMPTTAAPGLRRCSARPAMPRSTRPRAISFGRSHLIRRRSASSRRARRGPARGTPRHPSADRRDLAAWAGARAGSADRRSRRCSGGSPCRRGVNRERHGVATFGVRRSRERRDGADRNDRAHRQRGVPLNAGHDGNGRGARQ